MSRRLWRGLGIAAGMLLTGLMGGALWVDRAADARLATQREAHAIELAVPFPLDAAELEALRQERGAATPAEDPTTPAADPLAGLDLQAIALERAVARGEHLVLARYVCVECHGRDFGGGTMIDDPKIGRLLGPNLTAGAGGVTAGYTAGDWDRIVRHGLRRDGSAAVMPAGDFVSMTDRELSDIIAYIQSRPPVDRVSEPVSFGPLGALLVATGGFPLSAEEIPDHAAAHVVEPPAAEATAAFGAHLVQVCTGCHGQELRGGPIPGAPPDWIPAANLTQHADGLKGWTRDDFVRAMRESVRPDGRALRPPMTQMAPYAQRMTDIELAALWAWLLEAPPVPSPA